MKRTVCLFVFVVLAVSASTASHLRAEDQPIVEGDAPTGAAPFGLTEKQWMALELTVEALQANPATAPAEQFADALEEFGKTLAQDAYEKVQLERAIKELRARREVEAAEKAAAEKVAADKIAAEKIAAEKVAAEKAAAANAAAEKAVAEKAAAERVAAEKAAAAKAAADNAASAREFIGPREHMERGQRDRPETVQGERFMREFIDFVNKGGAN